MSIVTRGVLRRGACLASVSMLCLSLAECGVRPQPMTMAENVARAASDRAVIDTNYVPINGPLSLSDALARALKYNYDVQLSKLEVSLQEKQLDAAIAEMLPKLTADAGFDGRTNVDAAESIDARTNLRSLDYSYSEELSHETADIAFSWNVLDLGLSYFQAKQQGFRALIAGERRRKTVDGIVRSVTETYWRAAAANRIIPQLDPLIAQADRMLTASREAGERNLQAPLQLLDYQQAMIQVVGELRNMRDDLAEAQVQLAALVDAAPGEKLVLAAAPPAGGTVLADRKSLENVALALRPELRVEGYQEKLDRQDIYKEIVRILPGFGVVADGNFDSNNLLYRNLWGEVGTRATFNLMSIIQGPRDLAVAERTIDIDRLRRIALSVAVLTQVNLSAQQYLSAENNLRTADQIAAVGAQMARTASNASTAGAQSETDRVRHLLASLVTAYERDKAAALEQVALADVYSAAGVDLVPLDADLGDLPGLSRRIAASLDAWNRGELPRLPIPPAHPVPTKVASAL